MRLNAGPALLSAAGIMSVIALAYLAFYPESNASTATEAQPIFDQTAPVAISEGFEVVGHLGFDYEVGDVFYYDGGEAPTAYVGNYRPCGEGVAVVDVTDPAAPRIVGRATGSGNASYEDVVVERIGGRDILAAGIQWCDDEAEGGLALYDVTDRTQPERLGFLPTPSHGVHELDLVVRPDGTALALLSVPHAERDSIKDEEPDGDFWIVDITDPSDPQKLSAWGIVDDSSLAVTAGTDELESTEAGIGGYPSNYGHSVRAADKGSTAYVSYWDAGVLKFDISEPTRPRLLLRTHFDAGDDGDAHSMTWLDRDGTRYIFQNDEEIDNLSPVTVTSSATGDALFPAIEFHVMPEKLFESGPIEGRVVDAGDGCSDRSFEGADGSFALVDLVDRNYGKPPCPVKDQLQAAAAARAEAVLFNWVSADRPAYYAIQPGAGPIADDLPAAAMSSIDGAADLIRHALSDGADVTVRLEPHDPAWGSLRIFDESKARDVDGDGIPDLQQVGWLQGRPDRHRRRVRFPAAVVLVDDPQHGDRRRGGLFLVVQQRGRGARSNGSDVTGDDRAVRSGR